MGHLCARRLSLDYIAILFADLAASGPANYIHRKYNNHEASVHLSRVVSGNCYAALICSCYARNILRSIIHAEVAKLKYHGAATVTC